MFKNFLSITFAFLFLGSSLHMNHFEPSRSSSGYSFCKSGCTNKDCLSFSHECQECLKENNRFFGTKRRYKLFAFGGEKQHKAR